MSPPTRRRLIVGAAASLAAAKAAFGQITADNAGSVVNEVPGYGPLRPDPYGILDLPEGFSYTLVSRLGETMDDGLVLPDQMAGMGCFAAGGDRVVLVRNHAITPATLGYGPFGPFRERPETIAAAGVFDTTPDGRPLSGGVTLVVYDIAARGTVRQSLRLAGTLANDGGGRTPWGTWLTAEGLAVAAGADAMRPHGWVFEVSPIGTALAEPRPLTSLGRFAHGGVAADGRGVVYSTEDEPDGLFYRLLPARRGQLQAGGRLQVLAFADERAFDPRNTDETAWVPGDEQAVVWLDIAGADNPEGDLRVRGQAAGAARFAHGAGVQTDPDGVLFACRTGGPGGLGQVLRYSPGQDDKGSLRLVAEPRDPRALRAGRDLAIAPWGDVFVCEDGGSGAALRGLTPDGLAYPLARTPGAASEGISPGLAGACFSPDGSTLFVNIRSPGVTLAVAGPWTRRNVVRA